MSVCFEINYDEENKCFVLQMERSTYIMGLSGAYLGHIYYGRKMYLYGRLPL